MNSFLRAKRCAARDAFSGGMGKALLSILTFLAAGAVLTLPAALNALLIFYDTAGYLSRATAVTHHTLRTTTLPNRLEPNSRPTAAGEAASLVSHAASAYSQISQNFLLAANHLQHSAHSVCYGRELRLVAFAQGVLAAYAIWRLFGVLSIGGRGEFLLSILGLAMLSSLPLQAM